MDPKRVVDPTGGAFTFDPVYDTCTSSLYNRIKYLTPIVELEVLKVSEQEKSEYDRYKQRHQAFWAGVFDPIAARITLGDDTVKIETAVLPFANSSLYGDFRGFLDENAQPIDNVHAAKSSILSVSLVAGRKRTSELIRMIPGVPEALAADPTITDLSWLGDHVSVHYCDADAILEIDPTRLRSLDLLGRPPVTTQLFVSSALIKLYQVPIGEVNKLADSKYGVTYFGPDGGEYLTQHHGSYRFLKF